jgi:hypothetical protein
MKILKSEKKVVEGGLSQCTEVRFAILLFGGFTTMAVIHPPEKKLANRTSVQCGTAKECGPRTPLQEKQQPHGVEAILKNHKRTERYSSMICARDFTVYENSEIRKKKL